MAASEASLLALCSYIKLTTPHNVQPLSNGLTFPILKVSSLSFLSIFLAASSLSAISMLSLDQVISVSGLTFPICGGKEKRWD